MEDRFKFRVWDKEKNKYTSDDEIFSESGGEDRSIYELLEYDDCSFLVIEQCTGRYDRKGKLIYENDILSLNNVPNLYRVVWSYTRMGFDFEPLNTEYEWSDFFDSASEFSDRCAVIGNIHENSDLLEG